MKMLKTKHFRRLSVFLAMIAPAVYLFGSLFSALTGSHGQEVFASDEQIVTDVREVDLYQLVPQNARGFVANGLTVTFDYSTQSFTVNGTFDGQYENQYWLCAHESSYFVQGHKYYLSTSSSDCRVYFYTLGNNTDDAIIFTFQDWNNYYSGLVVSPGDSFENVNFTYMLVDLTASYGVGNEPDVDGFKADFPNVYYPRSYGDVYLFPVYSTPDYTEFVFNQFFSKDNFLVQWGMNAISENPKGFAPFGAFWRYLDFNVLHLSNDQVGLMGYGYIYYACHVLLFDIGFILVTFFLDFIQKIADKFTGGE